MYDPNYEDLMRQGDDNHLEVLEDYISECCSAAVTEAGEFCTDCWEHC